MDDRSIEFEIRSVNDEERTVAGLALPYGDTVDVGGYKERFERGAFADTEVGSPLYFNHDHRNLGTPIGSIIETRDTEAGLEIKARISKTPKGEEVYTLLRDGVLKKFSAGFEPVEHRTDKDGTVVRTKAKLVEVSIVPRPAYTNAAVSEVRSDADNNTLKENEMTETVDNSEVVELREQVSDLERKFAVLGSTNSTAPTTQYRSGGEFLKALASGEEAAQTEIRAFTGATLADADGDARPAWVGSNLRLLDEKRNFLNLFSKAPLPASGNSVEYAQVTGTAGTVGVQVAEGDDLPYMEVSLGTATAPVLTYGGYSSISRQAIERSDMAYLETVLRYQTLQYAKATNKAVLDAFNGASAGFNQATLAADDAESWIGLVIDSAALIEDNGQGATAGFIVVARDVFRRMVTMTDSTGRPLLNVNNDGQNTFGSLNVRSTSANLAGYTVIVDNNLAAGSAYVGSQEAVTVFESPGAPFRLQDENIINLTKDFSLYGYLAVAVTNPLAVVKVDADLVA